MKGNLCLGLISWLEIKETSEVLLLEKASKYKFFLESKSHVCCSSLEEISKTAFQKDNASSFDIILGLEILETEEEPERLLSIIKALLTQDGKLFLGADNRLGVRYLCGEKDPYTQRCFDGLDNYKDYQVGRALSGRCYAKAELKAILMRAGFGPKFYSVFPTLENPQLIIAEDYVPNERISARYSPMYRNPDTVFLQEEQICDDFAQNGIMHIMANSFLIECTLNNYFMDVKQVALSLNRGEENAQETIICSDRVEKKAIFSKGHKNLKNLDRNMQMLATHGISTVSGQWEGQTYVMPYMDAPLGNVYLQHLLREDADEFLLRMDQFKDLILQSSEIVDENESGMILKDGYIDMVPLNSFFQDGKFIFFDQEFCVHNYPVNAILYRAIIIVYEQMAEHEALVPIDLIWKRYGLNDRLDYLNALTTQFINDLRNYQELVTFYDTHMRNDWIADYNRERLDRALTGMNVYESYQGDNCFKGVEDKKIFLFGAGKWCDKFLDFYRNDNVYGILDNDEQKWGTEMHGIPIASPDSIVGEQEAYKVIICAKRYEPIFRQLKRMQVIHIGIYDANYIYAGRQALNIVPSNGEKKKYHIGYISGTFDLFHIGHINILRRAKEQCDYLIAAVTADEYVRSHKNKEPTIPFGERAQVLSSCKYVDEVVGVPVNYVGTVEAFQKYHFDCQFCGSDCENDSWWLEQKDYLQRHGSDLRFFPYTEQTSSTKIRALIDKGLL